MKHCPACKFSFPDFHCVCDFDGTELVNNPEPPVDKPPPRPGLRRWIKSPLLWADFLLIVILSSAYMSRNDKSIISSTSATPPAPAATARFDAAAPDFGQSEGVIFHVSATQNQTNKANRMTRSFASGPRRPTAAHSQVQVPQTPPARTQMEPPTVARQQTRDVVQIAQMQRFEVVRPRPTAAAQLQTSKFPEEAQPKAPQNQSKFTAMLKGTWRVLKKPFRF